MGSITPYETVKGRRYRVRYRKPDHSETEKRGFTTRREAQLYLSMVTTEVEGRVHRPVLVAGSRSDVREQLVEIQAAADDEALVLHDARARVEEPRRPGLG